MPFKSKWGSYLALGVTALLLSRGMFAAFNDPEGPNLLIVVGMAAIIYSLSLTVYAFGSPAADLKKLLSAVLIQMLLVISLYVLLG